MKNYFINCIAVTTILLMLINLSTCSNKKKTGDTTSKTTNANIEEVLTQLQYQEDKAEADKDFASLDTILSKDLTVDIAVEMHKFHIPNRDSFYVTLKSSPADTSVYKKPQYENIKITVSDDTAIMDYQVTFPNKDQQTEIIPNQFHNIVKWIHADDRWQTVAVQSSAISPKNK